MSEPEPKADRTDRAIEWFFNTRAIAVWWLVFGAFLLAELSFHGTRHPFAIAAAGITFVLYTFAPASFPRFAVDSGRFGHWTRTCAHWAHN